MSKTVDIEGYMLRVHTRYYDQVNGVVVCKKGENDKMFFPLKARPHGKWDRGFCSACGKRSLRTTQTGEIFGIEHTPFCKNCGADMRTKDGKICETMMGW